MCFCCTFAYYLCMILKTCILIFTFILSPYPAIIFILILPVFILIFYRLILLLNQIHLVNLLNEWQINKE